MKRALSLLGALLMCGAVHAGARAADGALPAGLPNGQRFVLDNGLTVLLLPNDGNPYLDIQLGFRAGGGLDPEGKEGLTSLMGRMLSAGIPDRDEAALAAELAKLGGAIGPDVGMESFVVGGQIPTLSDRDVRRFLDIFVTMVVSPTLPAAVVEREKTLRQGLLRRISDNPAALANIAARLVAFGDNAFGRIGYGSPESIARIEHQDIVDLHRALINPRHAVLIVGGAFEPAAMRRYIERKLGGSSGFGAATSAEPGAIPGRMSRLCAKRGEREVCFDNPLAAPPPTVDSGPRTVHVVFDDANLSQVPWRLVARNPIDMLDPSYPAFRLGTFVLGGEYTSFLNTLLRVNEGLTYGAYFQTAFGGHFSGAMMVTTDATPDALERSIALAEGEIKRIGTAPLPDAELDQHRAMLINAYPFRFETIETVVDQYLTLELASVPLDWLASWRDTIARPVPSEVRAAMTRVDPAAMSLVVVAPAELADTIAKVAHGPVTTISASALLSTGLP